MTSESHSIIEIDRLTKEFRSRSSVVKAVDNISFTVKKGDMFGFLGPNGAGKTTTIRMLCGALDPTSGSVSIDGHDILNEPLKVKETIGVMPEEPGFYGSMTGRQHLKFYAQFYDSGKYVENIEDAIEKTNIKEYVDRKVREYSHGMKKRLALAQSLVHDPDILIMDEPTGGLDPQGTHFFRSFIKDLNKQGKTIFLSSHILSEVQEICNRVGIIRNGQIKTVDLIENLSDRISERKGGYKINIEADGIYDEIISKIEGIDGVLSIESESDKLSVLVNNEDLSSEINSKLIENGVKVKSINIDKPDLEEIFLNITEGDE
ncbi:MAG: ATP-binding cassette domain-containing protein [Thermoplasmata archaeon]